MKRTFINNEDCPVQLWKLHWNLFVVLFKAVPFKLTLRSFSSDGSLAREVSPTFTILRNSSSLYSSDRPTISPSLERLLSTTSSNTCGNNSVSQAVPLKVVWDTIPTHFFCQTCQIAPGHTLAQRPVLWMHLKKKFRCKLEIMLLGSAIHHSCQSRCCFRSIGRWVKLNWLLSSNILHTFFNKSSE